ncbi:MAG: outer membrane protein assembly factor BamC [Methylosarcina sp.]
MRFHLTSLFISLCLAACGTVEDARYRDTSKLELPPNLQAGRESIQHDAGDEGMISESNARKGLGDLVYMTSSEPAELKLKQPFDIAWNTLASAFRQSGLEIKDRDRDKGLYYVTFDPDDYVPENESLMGRMGGFLVNDYNKATYVLTVTAEEDETKITAAKANNAEQGGLSESMDEDEKPDGAERLLLSLYQTLRDDWIEK